MPEVLFVCVHNAGRSQMAKAMFNSRAVKLGLPFRADSAGTNPSDRVNPEVTEVMDEMGLDVSAETPRLLTDDMLVDRPRIITMGCAVDSEACPSLKFADVVDWGLPDPRGLPAKEVRNVRDEIERRVDELLDEFAGIELGPTDGLRGQ